MSFDILGAKKAGYSDAEITQFLAEDKSTSFDVKGALDAGYSPEEVVGELAKHPAFAAGKQELEDAAKSPAANHFTTAMPRDAYEKQFLANNPQASRAALDAVLAQYDKQNQGAVVPGNIDLSHRPRVINKDGSVSTVRSMSVNIDGKEVLIPTVAADGRSILSNDDAIKQYQQTGQHLGMFNTPEQATAYAQQLHEAQAKQYEMTPEAMFNARLNERLQGKKNGVVPQLPGRISPDMPHIQTPLARLNEELAHELAVEKGQHPAPLPPSNVNPADLEAEMHPRAGGPGTIATNAAMGLWGTVMGAEATGASLLGMDNASKELDAARAHGADVARLNGGDTILGKTANLAGAIAPAMVSGGAGLVPEIAGNASLFGAPAARDAYREQKAKGASEAVAIEHAMAAMGINTALPMIAPGGSKAIAGMLGAAEAGGLKGVGVQLAQAAGEGAGFAVANSASHKAIDAANGIQTADPWVNLHELPSEALAFATLRGAHIAGHGIGSVASAIQQARQQRALIDNIGRAGSVDEAIAAATAAVSAEPAADNVADILQSIRPLTDKAPEAVAPQGRIEPTLGEPAVAGTPAELGRKYVRVQDADGSTRFEPTEGAIHEAAPAEGSDGGTGSGIAGRPGETVGERPAAAGTVPDGAAPVDALPGQEGGADPVRAGARAEPSPALGDGWHAFPAESGTLGIPRADMPQIESHARGAMTQFLKARGIDHEQVEIPADRLKPTQAEFHLDKVEKAHDFTGDGRSILVSSDGHVLDGHHQWLAAVEKGESVKAIRLDAPIKDLLEQVKEFPSATTSEGAPQSAPQNIPENIPDAPNHLEAAREKHARQDEVVRLAAETIALRKATGGERARERVANENPFLHFLATHGISTKERSDTGAEKGRTGNPMVPGFGPVYRKSGLRLDELALAARDAGFLTEHDIEHPDDTGGTRKLSDLIQRAVHGKEVVQKATAVREPSADEQLHAEAHKLGIDTAGKIEDDLYDAVAAAHAERAGQDQPSAPKAADPLDGIPRTFLKKTSVEHPTYNAEAKRWDTAHLPADQALRSVREDISNLEAMLKCMKG